MTGRLEEELYIENKIMIMLQGKPNILFDYYNSLIDETYNTKNNYLRHVVKFIEYMNNTYEIDFKDCDDLNKIKSIHINNHINQYNYKYVRGERLKNTNSYKANKLSALRNFFEFLCDNDIIEYNPCLRIKTPKDKRLHNVVSLNKEEIQTVKNNIKNGVGSSRAIKYQRKWTNRDMAIIMVGITTGLRVSAICNINLNDISFKNKTIRVIEKGDIEKEVYIPDNVIEILKDWLYDREDILSNYKIDALFISSQKKRITTHAVRNIVDKYTYNIDKKITPHKLRSTAATNLLEKTDNIYLVAEVLGHKNIQNTKKYAGMSNDKKIEAANILGNLF